MKRMPLLIAATVMVIAAMAVPVLGNTEPSDHYLIVDGITYQPDNETGGAVHYYTPGGSVLAAHTERHTWTGNGSENMPCEGGTYHWIDNANNLVISHCDEGGTPSTTEPGASTTVPLTSTTTKGTTTTHPPNSTTSSSEVTTTTSGGSSTTSSTSTVPESESTTTTDPVTTTTSSVPESVVTTTVPKSSTTTTDPTSTSSTTDPQTTTTIPEVVTDIPDDGTP